MYRILYLPTTKYINIVSLPDCYTLHLEYSAYLPSPLISDDALYHPLLPINESIKNHINLYETNTQRKAEQKLFKALKKWNKYKHNIEYFLSHTCSNYSNSLVELSMQKSLFEIVYIE